MVGIGLVPFLAIFSALAQQTDPGALRVTPLVAPTNSPPGFTRMTSPLTGVAFTNELSDLLALNNQILENGAGVALGDVDGDGRCDIYLCGSENDNALFLNQGGWKFTNVTASAGVACKGQFSTGALFADVDGDGDLDLLVSGLGVGTRLFLNDGRGHFTESKSSGLRRSGAATSMAMADLDGDGDLDLYVCHYRTTSIRGEDRPPSISAKVVDGRAVVTPADRFFGIPRADGSIEIVEKGEADRLYWNDGKGRFTPASWTQGTFTDQDGRALEAAPEDWGLSVSLRDLDGDGAPDIYVCNDFFRSRDRLWLGDGRGRFRAASPEVIRGFPLSSMSIDVADVDRDGHDDFFVAEMLARAQATRRIQRANAPSPGVVLPITDPAYQIEHARNVLQRGRGDGTFADVTWLSGLAATDWTWNVAFLDVDLDGWEDLLVATGNAHDVLDMDAQARIDREAARVRIPILAFYPPLLQPNLVFRNNRDLTFTEADAEWGFNGLGISQGMALADLDGDGDLDVVVNNLNQEAWLYRNNASANRLTVQLRGTPPNSAGIGARITVSIPGTAGVAPVQSQAIAAGGRYLSSDQTVRTFALGTATNASIQVRWPDGRISHIDSVPANHLCEVIAPTAANPPPVASTPPSPSTAWFTNVSALLAHTHRQAPAPQPPLQSLLPARLDAAGPGVAWIDWDQDGWDDIALGASAGGRLAVFRNDGRGGFEPVRHPNLDTALSSGASMVLGARFNSGFHLLATAIPAADHSPPAHSVRAIRPGSADSVPVAPTSRSDPGPMAMADVDGDGDLDLFIGGRVIPGRWPEAASSQLLLQKDGAFEPAKSEGKPWSQLGMIQGAVFSDLDDDGDTDLALACEWGAIRLLRNDRGQFTAWDPTVTVEGSDASQPGARLSKWIGRWTGIVAGDFNGDGRPDLVVGNWGRNTRESASAGYELWHGDFSGGGGVEILETILDPATDRRFPWRARDELLDAYPWIPERFASYRAFAATDVDQFLSGRDVRPSRIPLVIGDSVVLLSRPDGFALRSLPMDAQLAPVFGLAVADFDGDGNEDLFLAQNFFGTEPETSRLDAGRGLVLAGDGLGGFRAVSARESGVKVAGEQRGVAVADFDQDGRPDVLLGQNNGPTQLFRNGSGRPGLRIRLLGPAGNPEAVGARLRLRSETGLGPAREIRAGSGFLSQDSSITVLATPVPATPLVIRWPGGRVQEVPIPPGATTLEVRHPTE